MQLSVHAHGPRREPVPPASRCVSRPAFRGADGGVPPQAIVLDALRPIGAAASVRRGRQIFAEGEPAAHWYWLASGAVQVCSFAEDGKRHVAELVLPGDMFGLEACARRGAAAEAARDAVVVAFPRAQAEALVDAAPRLARAFREVACGRLHHAQACLLRLGRTSALGRVASFLLEMGERCRRAADGAVEVPVTRDDIADYLGLTSETVSRALTELRRRGAIALPARQSIHLADRAALALAKEAGR
jgi:CRP-like cAMP-binding protein